MLFCLKCKVKTESIEVKREKTKNDRIILKGICVKCGKKKAQFVKDAEGGDLVDFISNNIGEMHLPGSNFTGPGTRLVERLQRGDKPTDRVDLFSLNHDISYYLNTDKEKRHEADRKLLKGIDSIENPTTKEKIKRTVVKAVIKPKLWLGLGENIPNKYADE